MLTVVQHYHTQIIVNFLIIYTIIRHKSVDVRKLQVAILALSFREMSLTDRILSRGTSSHEFASRFGLEFFIREKTANHSRPQTELLAARRSRSPLSGPINNLIGNDVIHPAL